MNHCHCRFVSAHDIGTMHVLPKTERKPIITPRDDQHDGIGKFMCRFDLQL